MLLQMAIFHLFNGSIPLYTRSFQKVSSHVIRKIETFIEEDTRNIVQRTVMLQAPSK